MMHPEFLESSSSFFEENSSTFEFDQFVEKFNFEVIDAHVGDSSLFNPFFSTPPLTSNVHSTPLSSLMFNFNNGNNNIFDYPIEDLDSLQFPSLLDYVAMELDEFDPNNNLGSSNQVIDYIQLQGYHEESDGGTTNFPSQNFSSSEGEYGWSPTSSMKSDFSSSQFQSSLLTLPQEGIEIDKKVVIPHMLEAFGEALCQGYKSQAEEILRCISHKVSPISEEPLERLAFYLCQEIENYQGDFYLKQEADKNFEFAFKALYQGTPYGKVPHFVANSSILEAIPHDCEVVHIFDFDLGNGVQWPPMIEAIASMKKTWKLTSIKWGDEGIHESDSTPWNFEETRRNLYAYARSCGLMLKVEEKSMEEVILELKKLNKRDGKKDFLAFNCMVGLAHMGRERSRKNVIEFLNLINSCCQNRGIVTFGDGGAYEKLKNDLNFRSFFNGHLVHYKALLDSIESHFPTRFLEARTCIESIFVGPNVSSHEWLQNWEEMREGSNLQAEIGLEGNKLSKEVLMEVKEILKGCEENSYEAKIEGQNGNDLVLQWKGIQLVRVSTWKM